MKMNISQSPMNTFMSELSSLCNSSDTIVKSEEMNKMATLAIPNVLDCSVKNENLQEMASQFGPNKLDVIYDETVEDMTLQRKTNEFDDIIHDETVEVITFQRRPDEFYVIHDENVEIITFQRGANVLDITKNENSEEIILQSRASELDLIQNENMEEIQSKNRPSLLDFSIKTENVEEMSFGRYPSGLDIVRHENLEECLLLPSDIAENTNNANVSSDTRSHASAHKTPSISSKLNVSNHENRRDVNREGTNFAYQDVYTSRSEQSITEIIEFQVNTMHDCVDGIPSPNCEGMPIENQSNKSGKLNQPTCMVSTRPDARAIDLSPVDSHWTRNNLIYSCNICNKTYERLDKTRDHIRMHLNVRPYACSEDGCKKTFTTLYNLNSHVKKMHRPRAFACSKCDKTFFSNYDLMHHEGHHSNAKPYKCNECGKHFHTNIDLKIHTKSAHENKGREKEQCEICGSMIRHGGMRGHIHSVHLKKRYKCDVCAFTCASSSIMKEHGRVHGDGDLLTCDICSKTFVHKTRLSQHLFVHSRPSFPCTKCDRKFISKQRRDDHLGEHDGTKKYLCKVCGKRFTYGHYLGTHMKSHGLKKFICDICGGKFNRKDNLKSHVLRHQTSGRKNLKKKVADVG